MIGSLLGSPSKTLMSFADELLKLRHLPAVDIGCGFGRNAVALASRGISVVCVDRDLDRLRTLATCAPEYIRRSEPQRAAAVGVIYPVCSDVLIAWPFPPHYFSAVICVHFFSANLIGSIVSSLVPDGFLYIETFGDHGRNYLDLPRAGELRGLLAVNFHVRFYKERKAGPFGYDAVSAKVFAHKKQFNPATRQPFR
jgi:SAM-dependent methyltransferase